MPTLFLCQLICGCRHEFPQLSADDAGNIIELDGIERLCDDRKDTQSPLRRFINTGTS
jgi:hypothetical protein